VSEADAKAKERQRVDPVLKLFRGMNIMVVTNNIDVENGIANGTQGYVTTKVVLKAGEKVSKTFMSASDSKIQVRSLSLQTR